MFVLVDSRQPAQLSPKLLEHFPGSSAYKRYPLSSFWKQYFPRSTSSPPDRLLYGPARIHSLLYYSTPPFRQHFNRHLAPPSSNTSRIRVTRYPPTGTNLLIICPLDIHKKPASHELTTAAWNSTAQHSPLISPVRYVSLLSNTILRVRIEQWVRKHLHFHLPSIKNTPVPRQPPQLEESTSANTDHLLRYVALASFLVVSSLVLLAEELPCGQDGCRAGE